MSQKMIIIMMIEITTSSHICLKEKKVKILVFIVHSRDSRDLAGSIIIKVMINIITQI